MICTIINQYSGKVKGKREKKGEKVKKTRGEQPVCARLVAGGAWWFGCDSLVGCRFAQDGCGGDAPRGTFSKVPLGTPQNLWGMGKHLAIARRFRGIFS